MFDDPFTIVQTPSDRVFQRTGMSADQGWFSTSDGSSILTVSHANKARSRHTVRLDRKKVAANPLDSSLNAEYNMATYLVVDVPRVGFTAAEAERELDALTKFFIGTGANERFLRLLANES